MEILKVGPQHVEDRTYECTCIECKSQLRFRTRDLTIISRRSNGDMSAEAVCPVCRERLQFPDRRTLDIYEVDSEPYDEEVVGPAMATEEEEGDLLNPMDGTETETIVSPKLLQALGARVFDAVCQELHLELKRVAVKKHIQRQSNLTSKE